MSTYHTSVLLHESVDALDIQPSGTYVDLTFGGGGHSREILARLNKNGRLIAFDQDLNAQKNFINDNRFTLVGHNFRFIRHFLTYLKIEKVDGILGDLGVSSHHFDTPERGFSFRFDAPLDMRMNQNCPLSAKNIVNNYDEENLQKILINYGDIPNARKLVNAIVVKRNQKEIETTFELKQIVENCFATKEQSKILPKVFQALRIEVNNELGALQQLLRDSVSIIRTNGRLVIISYHSLEDRMVKNLFANGSPEKNEAETDLYGNRNLPFKAFKRKAIVPSNDEIEKNPRARSAKLRIGIKL